MEAEEDADQRNGDGQGGRHDIGQVFWLTEQAEDDGVQGKLANSEEQDQSPMKYGWKWDRCVSPEFFLPSLIHCRDGLETSFNIFQTLPEGLINRLKFGNPERGPFVEPLNLLFPVSNQGLLE